jgi:hypothetical protein
MKILYVDEHLPGDLSKATFESDKALAYSLADASNDLLEPALIAWLDRSTAAPRSGRLLCSRSLARMRILSGWSSPSTNRP